LIKKIEKIIQSDILIVGGAGAAVMSALRAIQAGVSVAVAVKGKVGRSGNTIMIGGGFSIDGEGAKKYCGEENADQGYTPKQVFEKLVTSGFYLGDQRLQKLFVEEAPHAVNECLRWAKEAGQLFQFNPRSCSWRTSGAAFGKTIKQGIRHCAAADVYEDIMIVELLKTGNTVCGALGIDVYSGRIFQFNAKAVILASGGFQPFSFKNTHNDMTGDGIALALRAGASVVDMEFLLFIGTILEPVYARGSILPFIMTVLFTLKPKITDLDGRELVFPLDECYKTTPTSGKVNKLLMAKFYGDGIFEKIDTHGNAFYYDYSAFSDDEIREGFHVFSRLQSKWHREGYYNGINLAELAEDIIRNKKRLKVAFGNEYSMGGVVVNPDLSTEVPGLFAAGEVSGGTFGAFRSGDGLTEMLAHGFVAGQSAARYVKEHKALEPEGVEDTLQALFLPFERKKGPSPADAYLALEQICDAGFDFYRDGPRLERAYEDITRLWGDLDKLYIANTVQAYNLEWLDYFIVRNLSLCARIGIYAALNRRESRGTHLRTDYPEVNNKEYLFNFVARLKDGALEYTQRRPVEYYLPLDTRNYQSVTEFIADKVLGGIK
jgi:succinate dehydrogenase / fumarate reductase flavoprotein subunit